MVSKVNRVITFYSYKGGVGRSMAMANIGALLTQWGYRTLVIDWDLEAPGLENYFKSFIDLESVKSKNGLIDLLVQKKQNPEFSAKDINWREYVNHVQLGDSTLDFITAGKQNELYIEKVRQFDFIAFYKEHDGGQYIEDLREHWLDNYDFVLIDSRTGLTDSSGICSIHMPDILVLFFTPNEQSFQGIKSVSAKAIEAQKQIIFDRFQLRTLPIPSRIENAETALFDYWMNKISNESHEMLEWLPKKDENPNEYLITPAQFISKIKIPYKTLYAYGESLAVIDRGTSDSLDLGYVYETIAAVLANDLQNTHLLINSRDALIKKAKGEDIKDESEFVRKIQIEKEEKIKAIYQKDVLEVKLRTELQNAQELQVSYRKRRSRFLWGSAILILFVPLVLYFSLQKTSNDVIAVSTSTNDSLNEQRQFTHYITTYTNSDEQAEVPFNLVMLKAYYKLDKRYQDSLTDIRTEIEKKIAYRFLELTDSFYQSLRERKSIESFLSDTLIRLGSQNNVPLTSYLANYRTANKLLRITNRPVDSTFSLYTDSSGIHVRFKEVGNTLLDRFKEYKKVESVNVISFDSSYRIQSLEYQSLDTVSNKVTIELFFCKDIDSKQYAVGNRIVKALRSENKYNVYTKTNFTSSSDPSSPYHIESNEIRYFGNVEKKVADEIITLIKKSTGLNFVAIRARTPTNNYLSVFMCNSPSTNYSDIKK
jgi:cellulose biosynthesis protein BcsQ